MLKFVEKEERSFNLYKYILTPHLLGHVFTGSNFMIIRNILDMAQLLNNLSKFCFPSRNLNPVQQNRDHFLPERPRNCTSISGHSF